MHCTRDPSVVAAPRASVRWPVAAAMTIALAAPAAAAIDLEFRPEAATVVVGETARIGLYAVSDDPEQSELLSALEVVFTWSPDDLRLVGLDVTDAVPLLLSAFPIDDIFGLNETVPPQDGNGYYLALAELGEAVEATPEGTLITTFEMEALRATAETALDIEAELQIDDNPPGRSRVFSGVIPGLEVTGELRGTVIEIVEACREDLDGSGAVDFGDILAVLSAWGACEGCPEDLNGDDVVDFADVLAILGAWGPCP